MIIHSLDSIGKSALLLTLPWSIQTWHETFGSGAVLMKGYCLEGVTQRLEYESTLGGAAESSSICSLQERPFLPSIWERGLSWAQ